MPTNQNLISIIVLVFILSISHAGPDTNSNAGKYLDMETFQVRHDKIIQYDNSLSKILPSITLVEISDGQLAVMLSLNTPEYFKRDKLWTNEYRVVYQKSDGSRILGKLDGESFSIPDGHWVSSLSFVPINNLLKEDVKFVIVQAKISDKRLAYLEKREQDRIERERLTDEMLPYVPFSESTIGEIFDFRLVLQDDIVFDSKQYRGKILLINYWSWYCSFCKKAIPELKLLHESYPENQVEILGIIFDDYDGIDEYMFEKGVSWPQWKVKNKYLDSAIMKKLKFKGIPYYMLINQSGKLVKHGYSPDFDLTKDIQKLLNQ